MTHFTFSELDSFSIFSFWHHFDTSGEVLQVMFVVLAGNTEVEVEEMLMKQKKVNYFVTK